MKCRNEAALDPVVMQCMRLSESLGFKYDWKGKGNSVELLR